MRERVSQLELIESVNRKRNIKKQQKQQRQQQQQPRARMNNNNEKKRKKERKKEKSTGENKVCLCCDVENFLKKEGKMNNQPMNIDTCKRIFTNIFLSFHSIFTFTFALQSISIQ